jgi:hypothetical protein
MAPQAVAAVEWGLSPYRTHPHLMRELQPDVVLTQVGSLEKVVVLNVEKVVVLTFCEGGTPPLGWRHGIWLHRVGPLYSLDADERIAA